MQVTLDIPNPKAWQALQPLVQYLAIKVVNFQDVDVKLQQLGTENNQLGDKMALMKEAQTDMLFQADVQAISADFVFIDQENI